MKTILLVDDSATILISISNILGKAGYGVEKAANAPVDLITRIRMQSKFHPLIESGAIIHAFIGEERPSTASVLALVRKTFEQTQAAQLTLSPEFTICNSCQRVTPQLTDHCAFCNSTSVAGMTRIVGYYSRVNNWNKSKLGELKDRHRGNYRLGGAPVEARPAVKPAAVAVEAAVAAHT